MADGALAMTAEYVSSRHQFGKPLATFQAVGQRAADAYITVQAMRATRCRPPGDSTHGLEADRDVEVLSPRTGRRRADTVVHACQHLHGGIGADVEYPVHRYFLWGMQIGTSSARPAPTWPNLGRQLATGASP